MNKLLLISFLFISTSNFSQDSISEVSQNCLYYFYEFSCIKNNNSFSIKYPEKTGFISGKPTYNSYYSKNKSTPYDPDSFKQLKTDLYKKELKKLIKLELVDAKIKDLKKYNKYKITDKKNIKTNKLGEFYLPINNKKDSIFFKDEPIEAYMTRYSYIGEMEYFDSYLVQSYFEGPTHFLINKKNGSKTVISSGIPNYSPNGVNLIDIFAETATYQNNESACLTIINNKTKNKFKVNFKSWAPSSNPEDYFWISNNEIVFKIYPIRKYINEPNQNKLKSQYLKLKIL